MNNSLFDLLIHYEREINYLKNMGSVFSTQYPKIAHRLGIGHGETRDPHVERLIESFAFLTASLQQDIENEFPRISTALLTALYPQFTHPLPPFSIAHLKVDPKHGKLTSGYTVPKDTPLFAHANEGVACNFLTKYPVELWPIEVIEASLVPTTSYDFPGFFTNSPHFLRVRLSSLTGSFKELSVDKLRFYIHGSKVLQNALYEGIFTPDLPLAVALDGSTKAQFMPQGSLYPVGFTEEESILPLSNQSHPAYGLLLEYFYYPDKFFFFDISGLNSFKPDTSLEILFPISNSDALKKTPLSQENFLLGCTPILNLFKKISEPIKVDHLKSEYRLVPDQRRELTTEIHSISMVQSIEEGSVVTKNISPYFAFDHQDHMNSQDSFWYARRTPSQRPGLPGTDIMLSFINFNFDPVAPNVETVFAYTLCTNRLLATELPPGVVLEVDETLPTANISCLYTPTNPVYPPHDGQTLWSLISSLSLNKISLANTSENLEAFKSILRLYVGFGSPKNAPEVEAIVGMNCAYSIERLGNEAWRNFARGIGITLTMDEHYTGGTSSLLFASVLNQFLGLYVSVNSFTQLNLKKINQEGYWKQWPPISGEQILL